MDLSLSDTIAAVATAAGEAGIAIVRVSGAASLTIADRIFRCRAPMPSQRAAGTFVHGRVVDAETGATVDEAILLVFRAPHSYTREDVVEIQCHGGRVSARRVLDRVLQAGARVAAPGEFTSRAFLNGRLDLVQAEGVADLIRARTSRAAAAALERMDGVLSSRLTVVYDAIISAAAEIEASLDLEEDVVDAATAARAALPRLVEARSILERLLSEWGEGRLIREGMLVVIAGRPNAGKSTLLNALLGTERAIVTHIAGTTRDAIEEECTLDGILLRLVDTAGLRETDCVIEQHGVARARSYLRRADLVLYVVDAATGLAEEDLKEVRSVDPERIVVILNKCDLCSTPDLTPLSTLSSVRTSLLHPDGVNPVRSAIVIASSRIATQSGTHADTNDRLGQYVQNALTYIGAALSALTDRTDDLTIAASELRQAAESIGAITGRTYTPDILTSVFSKFCVGK